MVSQTIYVWYSYQTGPGHGEIGSMMIKNILKVPLFALMFSLVSFTVAHAQQARVNSIRPELLKKVTKAPPPNAQFEVLNSPYASWGVMPQENSSINLVGAWQKFEQKKEVVVAVIDTGIDPNHPFLKDNLRGAKGSASASDYGKDFSKSAVNEYQPVDQHGHGTHVSGIIKSVYPDVKILSLKYYNPRASGQDNLDSTIKALRYAVEANVDIINYSGGGPEPAIEELRILKEAERKGILVVAAAGNEESNIDVKKNAYYPASYGLSNIITVTAHDQTLEMLSSSNYGAKSVDISAPGYRIKSALPGGRSGFLTGTSQATAFVSGVAAMLKSQGPSLSAAQIKQIIVGSAKKEKTMLGKCTSGGRLDAAKAVLDGVQEASGRKLAQRDPGSKKNEGKILYRLAK